MAGKFCDFLSRYRSAVFFYSLFIFIGFGGGLVFSYKKINDYKNEFLVKENRQLLNYEGVLIDFFKLPLKQREDALKNHQLNRNRYRIGLFFRLENGEIKDFQCDVKTGTLLKTVYLGKNFPDTPDFVNTCSWLFREGGIHFHQSDYIGKKLNVKAYGDYLYGLSEGETTILNEAIAYALYEDAINKKYYSTLNFNLTVMFISLSIFISFLWLKIKR